MAPSGDEEKGYAGSMLNEDCPAQAALAVATPETRQALRGIFELLYSAYQVDFSHYRETTVLRRISRRISLSKLDGLGAYAALLRSHPDELSRLYEDLLLSFTAFFRDPSVFERIKTAAFPKLVAGRTARDPIRIWVPGCSTGEEVYSLAIALDEHIESSGAKVSLQLFGTDLLGRNIERARHAVYSDKIRDQVSPERLARYFDKHPEGFRVSKPIRELCVFAVQDVTSDPPFPRIDLVSCRNLLIYFDTTFQEMAIPLFHFALRVDGFLLLGTSETMGRFPELFSPVDQKINLFTKRVHGGKPIYRFPTGRLSDRGRSAGDSAIRGGSGPSRGDMRQLVDAALLAHAPPAILVDSQMVIRQFRGETAPFLEPASGEASLKLARMAREGLMPDIMVAVEQAKKGGVKVRKQDVPFRRGDEAMMTDLSIVPIAAPETGEPCFLILFEDTRPVSTGGAGELEPLPEVENGDDDVGRMRRELQVTKAHLQTIIEEKDEVNQSLWAANEEILSTNEELQSVNEEMEAAKEELESSNEELLALNEELHRKNAAITEGKRTMDAFFEQSLLLLFMIDLETGRLVRVNDAAITTIGKSEGALLQMSFKDVFYADSPDAGARQLAALAAGSAIEGERSSLDGEGGRISLEWTASPDPDRRLAYAFARDITRQQMAERSLWESERRFEAAAESLNGILWVVDRELRFVISKGRRLASLGVKPDQLVGKTMTAVLPEDDPAIGRARRVLEGETLKFETTRGQTTFSSVLSPLRDAEDSVIGVVGLALDISDRKAAEALLQESELRFRSVAESAMDIIFIKDRSRRFTFVNGAMAKLVGRPAEEIVGKRPEELLGDEQGSVIRALDDRCFAGESVSETEPLVIGNQTRYFHSKQAPLSVVDGEVQTIMGIVRDVTDLKLAEERIKESEARFRSYIAFSPDGIFVADEAGRYVEVNEAACQMTGYARGALIGMPMTQLICEDDLAGAADFQQRVVRDGRASGELRFVRKDGRLGTWIMDAVRLSGTRMLGFAKDITVYKQMSEELRHAEKMQAVGELAGGIAHDFNNQLSGILGYAEFLREEAGADGVLCRYADNIITGVKRASDLTAQMLAFSRKGKYLNTTVDLHRIVFEVVNLLKHSISKKVVIQQALRAGTSTTLGDPTQLQNAILNLALNARDAMPDGGTLVFTTEAVTLDQGDCGGMPFDLAPGAYLKVTVTDTGVGIPADIKGRIFEPFFTTKEQGQGTGMGLAAVYGTVKNHKGAISVSSVEGQGSRFVMHLPLHCDEDAPALSDQPPAAPAQRAAHILLVEDEPMIREVATQMLIALGYTVAACANGAEAVVYYRENHADVALVILDLVMPEMDGQETFEAMIAINPAVRALVSSGYSLDGKAQKLLSQGARGFIQKPYRKRALADKVLEVLGK